MKMQMRDNLPFITVTIKQNGKRIEIPNVLVDTGSASTILAADYLEKIEITPSADDVLRTIRGVGGVEVVYLRQVDWLEVADCQTSSFEI